MPKKKESKICSGDVALKALAYKSLNKQKSDAEKEMKQLRPDIEGYLDENFETDAKGNRFVDIRHGSVVVNLQKTARKTTVLKPEAIQVVLSSFPQLANDLLETVQIFRQDRLEELILNGTISEKDALRFVEVDTSYAFSVKIDGK